MKLNCHICNRELDVESDPLSIDCGGDCWGCIGEIEAASGCESSITQVRKEFSEGLRKDWMPRPETDYEFNSETGLIIRVRLIRPLGEPWSNEAFELKIVSKSSSINENLMVHASLITNADGECIYSLKSEILKNRTDLWYFIVRKQDKWGKSLLVARNA